MRPAVGTVGERILLVGAGFVPGVSRARFGYAWAITQVVDATLAMAQIPNISQGEVELTIYNGETPSNSLPFRVYR